MQPPGEWKFCARFQAPRRWPRAGSSSRRPGVSAIRKPSIQVAIRHPSRLRRRRSDADLPRNPRGRDEPAAEGRRLPTGSRSGCPLAANSEWEPGPTEVGSRSLDGKRRAGTGKLGSPHAAAAVRGVWQGGAAGRGPQRQRAPDRPEPPDSGAGGGLRPAPPGGGRPATGRRENCSYFEKSFHSEKAKGRAVKCNRGRTSKRFRLMPDPELWIR